MTVLMRRSVADPGRELYDTPSRPASPSSDMRYLILPRICAQFAGSFGSPLAHAVSAIAAARSALSGSPVWIATDSSNIACRPVGNDQTDAADLQPTGNASAAFRARCNACLALPESPNNAIALASR